MSIFICSNCGYGSATFIGRCPDCGEWNTLKKMQGLDEKSSRKSDKTATFNVTGFPQITVDANYANRLSTQIHEFDRALGKGIVPGQVILLTGEPGIGKSTLLLQALSKLKALYISGEESANQIKSRADRLKVKLESCTFSDTLQIEGIVKGIDDLKDKPDIIVIDSIQMLYSKIQEGSPGSITQLRECGLQLVRLAKEKHIAMILIGHVTKDGDIAGPKIVEHMVDTVLSFEGEKLSHFRILRATKNRFGSTDEIGIFEMTSLGLKQVDNPLAFIELTDSENQNIIGRSIAGVMEGQRPLFFEIQTLATKTTFAMPRRIVHGVEYNKVLLLLAVIKRHLSIPIDNYDIYINVAGGVEVKSPSADLAIIASVISSIKDQSLPKASVYIGEVGLLGEVRKVYGQEKICSEAKRIGFITQFTSLTIKNCKQLSSQFT